MALLQVRNGADSLGVGYEHGFESSSGFRDAFQRAFGEPPGRGRSVRSIATQSIASPLGTLLAGAVDEGVCLLEFTDRRAIERQLATARRRLSANPLPGRHDHLDRVRVELGEYFAGKRSRFEVPVFAPGTPFQESVWRRLREIPFGETLSYEALAEEIGRPGAQRAVGRANGDNRIAILIPCHRVVQKNGQLRGYGGGLWRKQFLLDLERSKASARVAVGDAALDEPAALS